MGISKAEAFQLKKLERYYSRCVGLDGVDSVRAKAAKQSLEHFKSKLK